MINEPKFASHPDWRRAEGLMRDGKFADAAALFSILLQSFPGESAVLLQLSYVASLEGKYRLAMEYALEASRSPPADLDSMQELISRLRTFNRPDVLADVMRRIGPPRSLPIPLLLTCAAQYSYLNQQARALELLDEAMRGDPNFPPTLISRAQVLMYLGRFEDAERDVGAGLGRAPEIATGWWISSRHRTQTRDSNHVASIRRRLAAANLSKSDEAQLANALHKELDDIGENSEAWAALERSNRAKRSLLKYSTRDTEALISALRQVGPTKGTMPEDGVTPIFIVGMHRSGTTLLEQLLDGHSDVEGLGELYDFTSSMRYATDHHCRGVIDRIIVQRSASADFVDIGKRYMRGVEWRLQKRQFFTDKLPSNFLNIGFICRALPNARILHMVRDPLETCFSNLRELFSDANAYSYDQIELADYYDHYQRLMAYWHDVFPGRIMDVEYKKLTRDTESVLREVSAFCGFDFEAQMPDSLSRSRAVATASAVQVREGIVARDRPKWKSYERYLQPLISKLERSGLI